MRLLDWLAHTAMLALAGLATLSLIGSLASVSNSALGDVFPGRVAAANHEQPTADIEIVGAALRRERPEAQPPVLREIVAAAPDAATAGESEIARWLKALTYAVVALAAIAAAGVIALVRIGSRIASR
ncbi:hypothetical protein [Sphingomonas sp.]|uniref:hypothetical protein n=1 Tax=Sphingomonas sp. TaxID=28214 RepID=UPI002DD62EA6|nr:hypothetical protein [Sphingomonas sp.]